ncbi:hypothetical protein PISMIDRAFT_15084 [Pisolithus microcarpus 441]|uniref:Helitron helicase-like domain-containing protein n=1 Tax=Pisolithus microcarpus 441 TaxID=765257 RepID=A0A0C9XYA7_9AGAM|nr:hypothetical protein PISMIDRAFT_15084 [Pisolithus microcarpus 441]
MHRGTFERDARLLMTITVEKLRRAEQEEEQKKPISDAAVRLLRRHIQATAGRVIGSDQSRYCLRSQIWSTSVMLNPPSLWLTINPCDLHDPIAQVFTGENINLDNFVSTLGPTKDVRAKNIALDAYAAAKFFHFMISTILRTLFGVTVTTYQVHSETGVFGQLSAYFGVVESQGQGSLHLHMLLWLKNAPCYEEMECRLTYPEFREDVQKFIKNNIRAYLLGFESSDSIKDIPNEVEVAYSRPPNLEAADYNEQIQVLEKRITRAKQLHTCEFCRCLVPSKTGALKCKRRAPFPRSQDDYISENGDWGMKRLHEYMNAWSPAISINARCNNDIKLLTNSKATSNLSYYITSYQTKKQGRNFNMSAVMAKGFAYHTQTTSYLDDLRNRQRLLIFRLVNTINREQELAAPMVMSYLMGWGDTYCSHHYANIYWSLFSKHLGDVFPQFHLTRERGVTSGKDGSKSEKEIDLCLEKAKSDVETQTSDTDDVVILEVDDNG